MRIEYTGDANDEDLKQFAQSVSKEHPDKIVLAHTVFSNAWLVLKSKTPSFKDIDLYAFDGYWKNGKFKNWQRRKITRHSNYMLTTND